MSDFIVPAEVAFRWFELLEIVVFVLLMVMVTLGLWRCYTSRQVAAVPLWLRCPEAQLTMLALPLHLLWELAQFPLYTVWHEGDWGYILYGLVHCTLGDLLILLAVFWLVAALNHNREWVYASPIAGNTLLFTLLGLAYTVYSEIVNTRIKGTWGYTELMPIVPVVEIGGTPFMQWLLISPILVWLMRLTRLAAVVQADTRD